MNKGKFVAYFRVSTDKQGQSGLGLGAQQKAVSDYLNGGEWEVIDEFTEVESGKRQTNRPNLKAAVDCCRKNKATLVIAKMDRVSRDAKFLLQLRDSPVDIIALDMPDMPKGAVGKFMWGQLALASELERGLVSERTKAALAIAKSRGIKLGKNGKSLARQNKAIADKHAQSISVAVRNIQASGFISVRQITNELNRRDVPTAKDGAWHIPTTHRLLKRLAM